MSGCNELITDENPVATSTNCEHPICLKDLLKMKSVQENSRFITHQCTKCPENKSLNNYDVDQIEVLFKLYRLCSNQYLLS